MKNILLINAGSSSIKFQLVEYDTFNVNARGICEAIGLEIGKFKISYGNQQDIKNIKFLTFNDAIDYLLNYLNENELISKENTIVGIGHRVVHDGAKTTGNVIIDDQIMKIINDYSKFAPLHNPFQLEVIKITKKLFKNTVQVACFDTGFHRTIPKENFMYALRKDLYEQYNIRKFGFHGLSYDFINMKMKQILKKDKNNLIVCHLGSGSSICCIKDSQSFATSMGFATYDGLVMATRTGDISPGVMNYLSSVLKVSNDEINNIFLKESGLKGISKNTDMRLILQNIDRPDNKLAFDLFIDKIVDYIAMYINKLGSKVDGIVFTGGIGENSAFVRKSILNKISLKKIDIDYEKNCSLILDSEKITTDKSELDVYVVKTNEEFIIAKNVKELIEQK